MGFLTVGAPLSFEETAKRAERIRLLGTLQLLRCYLRNHARKDPVRCFGHEVEYMLIHLNQRTREAKLMPCAPHLLKNVPDISEPDGDRFIFMPEFASYMVEATPKEPWRLDQDYILELVDWFKGARRHIRSAVERMGIRNVYPFTLTSFPLLGTPNSVCEYPMHPLVREPAMLSDFCSDILVNPHPRFGTLARNIRCRRGKKVHIYSPPFIQHVAIGSETKRYYTNYLPDSGTPERHGDEYTTHQMPPGQLQLASNPVAYKQDNYNPSTDGNNDFYGEAQAMLATDFIRSDTTIDDPALAEEIDRLVLSSDVKDIVPKPTVEPKNFEPIYMDAMVFGMGMCCLQTTFSCVDEAEARYLYDQLTVLAPLFLALTAATAAHKGLMSSHTTRWRVLSQSVDDRRDEEHERVPFSRFSTVSLYISKDPFLLANYSKLNDVPVPSTGVVYQACIRAGIDRVIARHFASIMSRAPLVAFQEDLSAVDIHATDAHFEAFQSTNWNTVRFKPPPLKDGGYPIPWRVEFRCCEAQLRDKESMAVVAVIALMVRVMLKERWNLYIPMSLVHQNMEICDAQDAIMNHKFHFVNNMFCNNGSTNKFTLREIFFTNDHLSLFYRCASHLDMELRSGAISQESYDVHMESLKLMKGRMCGTHATNSQEIRNFFLSHREFTGNGTVSQRMVYDMLSAIAE